MLRASRAYRSSWRQPNQAPFSHLVVVDPPRFPRFRPDRGPAAVVALQGRVQGVVFALAQQEQEHEEDDRVPVQHLKLQADVASVELALVAVGDPALVAAVVGLVLGLGLGLAVVLDLADVPPGLQAPALLLAQPQEQPQVHQPAQEPETAALNPVPSPPSSKAYSKYQNRCPSGASYRLAQPLG